MNLYGFDDVFQTLRTTKPKNENTKEWIAIRDYLEDYDHHPYNDKLQAILSIFSTIRPGNSNVREWKSLRADCSVLYAMLNTHNTDRIFYAFCYVLSKVQPSSSNKSEWNDIRGAVHRALQDIP